MPDDHSPLPAASGDPGGFQTQVLVALAEIKGSIALISDRTNAVIRRLDQHDAQMEDSRRTHRTDVEDIRKSHRADVDALRDQISRAHSSNSKVVGASVMLAFVVTTLVTVISFFIQS
jgi:hypothetical protein